MDFSQFAAAGGAAAAQGGGEGGGANDESDRCLPVANIARVMKKCLPPSAKISKEAKDAMQLTVSEFISFITSEASERCQQDKRKTIYGDDLVRSLTALGFDNYAVPLNAYLERIREQENPRGGRKRKSMGDGGGEDQQQ